MELQTLIAVMAVLVVVMAWYANSSKRDKIFCTFNRINKTQRDKFVKMTSRYVIFDGKKYDIIPSCVVYKWWDKGLVHMLFPQWVATMEFSWSNRFPHDPNTLKPAIVSPEVRNTMNKEEWVKSYAKSFTPPTTKKETMFQQYLPWVGIILAIVVGVYLYNNIQSISNQMAIMQNTLNSITK